MSCYDPTPPDPLVPLYLAVAVACAVLLAWAALAP